MITIIDYGAGNIASVARALTRIDIPYTVSKTAEDVIQAEKIIFPGQGRAGMAMSFLNNTKIGKALEQTKVPFLGICLGLQLLTSQTEEDSTSGLKIVQGTVKKFVDLELAVPHVGWNTVEFIESTNLLFQGIPNNTPFYFVHSYYFPAVSSNTTAMSWYGVPFAAAIQKEHFYGVQFHPEKSGDAGLQLLENFARL